MTSRPRLSRKILVASVGVATMTYMAACGSATVTNTDGGPDGQPADGPNTDTKDEFPVANLVARPDTGPSDATGDTGAGDSTVESGTGDGSGDTGVSDSPTMDDFPVANLVAHPG